MCVCESVTCKETGLHAGTGCMLVCYNKAKREVYQVFSCFRHRIPKENWWLKLRPLLRILAKHDSIYETEGVEEQFDEYSGTDKDKLIV